MNFFVNKLNKNEDERVKSVEKEEGKMKGWKFWKCN